MIHSLQQARKLFLTLICIELILVVGYGTDAWVQGPNGQLHELINLDGEGNLPAWFSSFQLALISISFWTLAGRARESHRPSRRFLRLCGGFFLLLSIDETAMLHERTTASLGSRYVDWLPMYFVENPVNALVCLSVLALCVCAAYPHVRALWQMSRNAGLVGACGCVVYVTGAAVLETIGYKMLQAGAALSLYRAEVALEEFFEMSGASLILYAVLLICLNRGKHVAPSGENSQRAESAVQSSNELVNVGVVRNQWRADSNHVAV
jgi:hypothetical protein